MRNTPKIPASENIPKTDRKMKSSLFEFINRKPEHKVYLNQKLYFLKCLVIVCMS
jgi:hypothetical protein